jgi:hypothetical protein
MMKDLLFSPAALHVAALAVLYFHFAVVLFNVFWLVAVPLGAWFGWSFVRSFRWRILHLAALVVVAAQAAAGRLCFLTILQNNLQTASGGATPPSFATRIVMDAIYWPLPDWVFAPLYVLALAFAAFLWFVVPPRRPHRFNI